MERIKDLLERITALYADKNKKTAIDIDLMLDYTRVLYAGLLEWKTNLPPGGAGALGQQFRPPGPTHEPGSEARPQHTDPPEKQQAGWEIQEQPGKPDNAWEERMEQEDEEKGAVITNEFPAYREEQEMPVIKGKQEATQPDKAEEKNGRPLTSVPPGRATDEKEETVKILSEDRSGISFEPPHPAEPDPELIRETLAADAPEVKAPVRETPADEAQRQIPSDHARLFRAAQSVNNARDIRKHIGINDKYLFLNELFNNNKTEYEEALDKLNKLDRADALKWIKETVAVNNKWYGDDETVKSFYDVLDKHFASR